MTGSGQRKLFWLMAISYLWRLDYMMDDSISYGSRGRASSLISNRWRPNLPQSNSCTDLTCSDSRWVPENNSKWRQPSSHAMSSNQVSDWQFENYKMIMLAIASQLITFPREMYTNVSGEWCRNPRSEAFQEKNSDHTMFQWTEFCRRRHFPWRVVPNKRGN